MTHLSAHAFPLALCAAAMLVATGCTTTPSAGTTQPAPAAAAPTAAGAGAGAAAPTPALAALVTTPPADPADVASVDAILRALYDVISGPAGQRRNWDRMRFLFVPGA